MTDGRHVVIVGAGVIGTACGFYLQERGYKVTLVDRGKFAAACSHGNCGLVCPSHVLPLAEPGAIVPALKSMLTPNSPFRVKFRLDPALWSWLLRFAKRCNQKDMLKAARGIQDLLGSSLQLYRSLVRETGLQCEWQERGLLFAYKTQSALDAYKPTNDLLADKFDEPARKLNRQELIELEPALRDDLAGGWFYEHDAHLRPDRLMDSWRKKLEADGGKIVEDCEMLGFETASDDTRGDGKTAISINTSQGTITADKFIMASGAWTPLLAQHVGFTVPIQPGKGYSLTMPRPKVCPAIPLIFPEHRVAVTPMETGYRLGSIMEFAGYDTSMDPKRIGLLKSGAAHYLKQPDCDPVLEQWYGWRPMTYDSLPVIDRSPAWSNVWVAAGHNMLGLSMAPGTGKLMAELIDKDTPHLDPTPYSAKRFI